VSVSTVAHITFRAEGAPGVAASVYLTGDTHIQCCRYDDRPPILALDDGPVKISVTVPDSANVTAEDLRSARRLSEAVSAYVADLEARWAAHDSNDAAAEGVAA
jgi:hypothetical protein